MYPLYAGGFTDGNLEHGGAADTMSNRHVFEKCNRLLAESKMDRLFHAYIVSYKYLHCQYSSGRRFIPRHECRGFRARPW